MIGQIEQAMIDRIEAFSKDPAEPLGYRLKKVASYAGEFSDNNIRQVIRDVPAVWVMFDGARASTNTERRVKFEARFGVFVATGSLRSEKEGRHGGGQTVGAYTILGHVIEILNGQQLGLQIDKLKAGEIRFIFGDQSDNQLASIYAITFTTAFELESLDDLGEMGEFKIFHPNWDIPIHGNVEKTLPADETADATDHVEIPNG